jgi:signal transduction histidine kinase
MESLWDRTKAILVQATHFKKRNRIKRYGLPIILVTGIFLIKHFFYGFLGDNSAFLLVSFIVAVSSWYGGLGPGLFATFLSAILTYIVFLQIDAQFHPFLGDIVVTIIFITEGFMISIASEARHQVEDQKDEFIAFVAHELKNPLAAIKGFSGLITKTAKNNRYEKIQLFSERITTQSDRILELINDLLDITKIEIGKFSYVNTFFSLEEITKEIVIHQRVIAKNRIIEFHGKSKSLLYGDKYRAGQVITNLLTNALKYSPEGKKVIVRMAENKQSVYLSVQDFGLGIPQNEQKKIFDRYYRARMVQGGKTDGIGIGLFISQQIIHHHHGLLWFKSKQGKGSTFFFSLPVSARV